MSAIVNRIQFMRALRSQPFALLWLGQTISSLGDGAFFMALAWQILLLTRSATAMGIVMTAEMIPRLLFLLLGGVAADRLPKRLVMLCSDAGRAIVVLAIALLGWFHLLQFWHLVALSLFFGVVSGFFSPAYRALPPQLVQTEDLTSANALTGLGGQLSALIGPVIGAGLVSLVAPASAFAFDGLTFVFSALCLFALRLPALPIASSSQNEPAGTTLVAAGEQDPAPSPRRGAREIVQDVREGLGYVSRSTWIWVTILVAALLNLGISAPLFVVMPKLVHDVYGAGAWLLGAIGTASALGSILATFVVGQVRQLHRRGLLAYLAIMLSSLAFMLFGWPVSHAGALFVAPFAGALVGFGLGIFDVIWVTVLQELIPGDKLGRVTSIDMLGSFCLLPLGYAICGVLADRIGPGWVFVAGGMLTLILAMLALTVRGIRQLD